MSTPLKDILKRYPENSFGSIDEGYLGYITNDYYYFFYKAKNRIQALAGLQNRTEKYF